MIGRQGEAVIGLSHALVSAGARETAVTIVFSEQERASVGPWWSDLDHANLLVGEVGFDTASQAGYLSGDRGLVRVYADRRDARVLGGAIVGPACAYSAELLAFGVQQRLTVHQMLQLPFRPGAAEAALQGALSELTRRIGSAETKASLLGRLISFRGPGTRAARRRNANGRLRMRTQSRLYQVDTR